MPYKNIVYAKLERRLLDDHRWYMMSEPAQLFYIKLILGACATYNAIPKDFIALRRLFKTEMSDNQISKCISEIKQNFPKFKENKEFYFFEDFGEKTNFIKGNPMEIPGKPQGLPQEVVVKISKVKTSKEKSITLTDSSFIDQLTTLYPHVNVQNELSKMDAWLLANPHRKKTRRFVVNWLNRIDKPLRANEQPRGGAYATPL